MRTAVTCQPFEQFDELPLHAAWPERVNDLQDAHVRSGGWRYQLDYCEFYCQRPTCPVKRVDVFALLAEAKAMLCMRARKGFQSHLSMPLRWIRPSSHRRLSTRIGWWNSTSSVSRARTRTRWQPNCKKSRADIGANSTNWPTGAVIVSCWPTAARSSLGLWSWLGIVRIMNLVRRKEPRLESTELLK